MNYSIGSSRFISLLNHGQETGTIPYYEKPPIYSHIALGCNQSFVKGICGAFNPCSWTKYLKYLYNI